MSAFDLGGRVVAITGGEGRIGRFLVEGLLEHGARVAVLDVAGGRGALAEDPRLMRLSVDVTSEDSLSSALEAIRSRWETPRGLINAAAIDAPPSAPAAENGPVEEYPVASLERVMNVNVTGSLLAARVFGAAMAAERGGSIVNIGSIYGMVSPDQRIYEFRRAEGQKFFKPISYSISKSALLNMTKYLATYWAEAKVRVNIVSFAGIFDNQDERFLAGYVPKVPLGRMADASECCGPVVFLISDAASYVTGTNLVVDGGYTAW
jgi:NAD(P)-dependent dehydrogenase (short-subunit alcohol dehydrogenase family)